MQHSSAKGSLWYAKLQTSDIFKNHIMSRKCSLPTSGGPLLHFHLRRSSWCTLEESNEIEDNDSDNTKIELSKSRKRLERCTDCFRRVTVFLGLQRKEDDDDLEITIKTPSFHSSSNRPWVSSFIKKKEKHTQLF